MTNPTPPLTAEEIVDQYSSVFYEHDTWMDYLISDIKAYAAQQNAELVAEANKDNVLIAQLHEEVADLQAENERLKQAAALYKEASFQGHSSHWDSQGTGGANCPACAKASSLRRQADELLPQPPKEATLWQNLFDIAATDRPKYKETTND